MCLDPTDPNSPTPEQEWIETACEFSPPEMDLETGPNRRWQYARSRAVDRFEAVGYEGSTRTTPRVTEEDLHIETHRAPLLERQSG